MRKLLTTAAAALLGLTLGTGPTRAEDEAASGAGEPITGVLIDNHCGPDMKSEEEAAEHPKKCATKDACAEAGYQVITGDKHLKLDDKGNELAKEYLAVKDHETHVIVEGTVGEDGTLAVTSIKPAEEKSEGKDAHEGDGEHEHGDDEKAE